jgi:hypothetical protein
MDIGFEAKVGVVRVLLPVMIGVLAVWLTLKKRGVGAFIGGSLFVLGFAISEFANNPNNSAVSLFGWLREILVSPPKEPWMRMLWVFPIVYVVSKFLMSWAFGAAGSNLFKSGNPQAQSLGSTRNRLGGVLSTLGAIALSSLLMFAMAYLLFPRGAGYEDKASMIFWSPWLILAATILNGFALAGSLQKGGGTWFLWTLVAQLGCIAVCILQGYASLGEWAVVLASLGGVTALLATLISTASISAASISAGEDSKRTHPLGGHVYAISFAAVALLSVSQVYSWSPLPSWFLLLLCFLPTVHVFLDVLLTVVFPNIRKALRIAWWVLTLAAFMGTFYWVVLNSVPQW